MTIDIISLDPAVHRMGAPQADLAGYSGEIPARMPTNHPIVAILVIETSSLRYVIVQLSSGNFFRMVQPRVLWSSQRGAPVSVGFSMAEDRKRRISGACRVHLTRSDSLPMVQLAATLARSDSATAQIYP